MNVIVDKIYKLSDDYQDIFINNSAKTHVKYNPVMLSSRTIHKDHYDDIYILEPHKFYKIEYELKNFTENEKDEIGLFFDKKLINSGLIKNGVDKENNIVYFYNSGENSVMIQNKAVIGGWFSYDYDR